MLADAQRHHLCIFVRQYLEESAAQSEQERPFQHKTATDRSQ